MFASEKYSRMDVALQKLWGAPKVRAAAFAFSVDGRMTIWATYVTLVACFPYMHMF
jgi:hypothetical protein